MNPSWSSHQSNPEFLLTQANHHISLLEESLEHIAQTKTHLRDHAQEVKTQIHSAISRQLETLRNREVWLLGQVEVIKQAKDDLLFQQQEEISRALGALKNALDCLESTMNSEDSNVEQVLAETLEKLKTLSLYPCEAPHITFKANSPAMKSAIFKFGKVDSKGLPTEVAFADPHRPSSSLPRCFEEYGDAEHHVLYKTLESVKRERSNDHSIQVKIPKLLEGGDWLYKPSASFPSPTQPSSSNAGKSSSTPLATWVQKSGASNLPKLNDASIQQWLTHIQEGEMEDDFEFLSATKTRTSSESASIVVVPMSEEARDIEPTFSYFVAVKTTPSTAWLLHSQANTHTNESTDGSVKSLASQLNYFRQISDRMEDWLPKSQMVEGSIDMTQIEDKYMGNPNADFCYTQCACRPDKIEIEDLEDITCVSTPGSKGSSATDLRVWLKRERKSEDDIEPPSLAKVCRANELCCSVGDCCCEPNCYERSKASNPWIFTDKNNPTGNKRDIFLPEQEIIKSVLNTWREILNSPMSDWLPMQCVDKESKEDMEKSVVKSMMSMSLNASTWLHEDNRLMKSNESCSFDSELAEDSNLDHWLDKRNASCVEQGSVMIEKLLSSLDDKEWLQKRNENMFGDEFSCKNAVIKADLAEWFVGNNMEV